MNIQTAKTAFIAAILLLPISQQGLANQSEQTVDLAVADPQSSEPASSNQESLAAQEEAPADAAAFVSEKAQSYIAAKRKKFSRQGKQVFMHSGTEIISVKPTEKAWGDARAMAYVAAQQKAREQLLKQLYVDVATKTIRQSFRSNQLPEFTANEIQTQSKLEAFINKLVALSEAVVDTELEELGIDPKEYDSAPASKRKVMMQKALTKTVKTAARGNISGSQIMKSYEKTDSNGNTAVAVIIATSNKKKNFLTSLYKSKGNIQPDLSKAKISVEDYLEKNKHNLLYQIGTKILWDDKGYPVLLSFGMAGNDCNPVDYEECVDNREFSFLDAELSAFSYISEAYHLTGKVESENSNTKDKSRTASVSLNESKQTETQEQTVAKIIKETRQLSELSSKVKGLVGIQQATRWTQKHPVTNREINGIVLAWHPLSEQETRAFKAGKPFKQKKNTGANVSFTPGSGESDGADDEDF